jgi:hypothetical protein
MGRGTEYFDYIMRDKEPDYEHKLKYCSLNVEDLKKHRQALAKIRKKRDKEEK